MKKLLLALLATAALAAPAASQQFGAGFVCVGPLSKEEVNHVRMSREGCDWMVSFAPESDGWLWADGWITAQSAYVWPVGTGEGEQHWMGRYQHELPSSYDYRNTVILACANGGPRLGRGHGWIGTGLGLCMFTGTGNLGAPMLAPSIPVRLNGTLDIGGLTVGIRPQVDFLIPMERGTTVFQEWGSCERGTIGTTCEFKETGNKWRPIISVLITVSGV